MQEAVNQAVGVCGLATPRWLHSRLIHSLFFIISLTIALPSLVMATEKLPDVGEQFSVQQLFASDASDHAQYGSVVAIDHDQALIGAWKSTSEGGKPAAYYYQRRIDGIWEEKGRLIHTATERGEYFPATTLAISGDTALYRFVDESICINFCEPPRDTPVRLFEQQGDGAWIEVDELVPSNGIKSSRYGERLALTGVIALVADPGADDGRGAVYIFEPSENGWGQTGRLQAHASDSSSEFGSALSVNVGMIAIGAPGHWSTGPRGFVHLYERDDVNEWVEVASLASDSGTPLGRFGASVALDGPSLVVGAPGRYDGNRLGAFYHYEQQASGEWLLVAVERSLDGTPRDNLAITSHANGDVLVTGATGDHYRGRPGKLHLWARGQGGRWFQSGIFTADTAWYADHFGSALVGSGNFLLVGNSHDSTMGEYAGTAYLITLKGEVNEGVLDIKPDVCTNQIFPDDTYLEVLLLGGEGLDVGTIQSDTIRLEALSPLEWHIEDVAGPRASGGMACTVAGSDGYADLVMRYDTTSLMASIDLPEVGQPISIRFSAQGKGGSTVIAGEKLFLDPSLFETHLVGGEE